MNVVRTIANLLLNIVDPLPKATLRKRRQIEDIVDTMCKEIEKIEGPIEFWFDYYWRKGYPVDVDNYYVYLPRYNRKVQPRGHVYKIGDPDHEYAKQLRLAVLDKFYYIMDRRESTRIMVSYKSGFCWSTVNAG